MLAVIALMPTVVSGAANRTVTRAAPLPANASPVPQAILNAIDCTSTGNCVAVGRYLSSSDSRALIATEINGSWKASSTIKMPKNASQGANGVLFGVSCTSYGNCVAVGQYQNTKSAGKPLYTVVEVPLIVSEKKGVWGTGIEGPLPIGAIENSVTTLNAVSCPKVKNCVAVGQYQTTDGAKGFTVRQLGTKWVDAQPTALPNWARPNFITQLDGVSCVAVGFCVAVGQYVNASPSRQALVVMEARGVWGVGHAVPLPTTVRNPWAGLFSIKCLAWGVCEAVGVVQDGVKGGEGLIETQFKGRWLNGLVAPLPSGAANPSESVQLASIDCTSFGFCDAVGQFTNGAIDQGVTVTESKGAWGKAYVVPRPANATSPPYAGLGGVDCSKKNVCVMVGQYQAILGEPALIVNR